MDFDDLKAFVHVANLESFSRAAAQLRIAQSALSRRVQRLEHDLGVKLLTRHGRGVRLSESGAILLEKAEELLRGLKQVESDVITMAKEPTGHVRIALPPVTGQILGPTLVERCRRECPKVTLHIMEGFSGYIQDWLVNSSVDIAILYNPEEATDLLIEPLLMEPLFLIAPTRDPETGKEIHHPSKVRVGDLAKIPLILPSRTYSLRRLIERLAAEHGFHPNVVLEVDGMRITKGLVERNVGYTVFSYAGVYHEVAEGKLQAIPLHPAVKWQLSLASKHGPRERRAVSELRRIIQQEVRTLVKKGVWRGQLPASR